MALTARSIITLDNAKDFLGIQTSNDLYDTFLETLIDWSTGWIEYRLGGDPSESDFEPQKVAAQDVTLILDGNGRSRLSLPYPIIALTDNSLDNLQYRTEADGDWTNLLTDIDFLRIAASPAYEVELLGTNYFPSGRANIRIAYSAGYNPVPDDLKILCLEKVAEMFKQSGRGESRFGLVSSTQGQSIGGSVTFKDLEESWEKVLRRYRKRKKTIASIDV